MQEIQAFQCLREHRSMFSKQNNASHFFHRFVPYVQLFAIYTKVEFVTAVFF